MAKKAIVTQVEESAGATPQIVLTPAEIEAILKARDQLSGTPAAPSMAITEMAQAIVQAIESTRPPTKKTPFSRKKGGPWEPKDGSIKPKLRRKMYQHGQELLEATLSTEEITLLNKIKPGAYCGGHVRVIKRKDRGIDVDYPVRTASQRLKLVNAWGITSFTALLQRLITEAENPDLYRRDVDDE